MIFPPFLRSLLEMSLIICQNKSLQEKIAWRYPVTQKDKCYIHRGGAGECTFRCFRELIKWSVVWSGSYQWRAALAKALSWTSSWVSGKTLRSVLEATKLYLKKLSHSHFAYLLLRPDHSHTTKPTPLAQWLWYLRFGYLMDQFKHMVWWNRFLVTMS